MLVFFLSLLLALLSSPAETYSKAEATVKVIVFHDALTPDQRKLIHDGTHLFKVTLLQDSAIVSYEEQRSTIEGGEYNLLIGQMAALSLSSDPTYIIRVQIDHHEPMESGLCIQPARLLTTALQLSNGDSISAEQAEQLAEQKGNISAPVYTPFKPSLIAPESGPLQFMVGASLPFNVPTDPYLMMKYGMLGVEAQNLFQAFDQPIGFVAKASHMPHHLMMYSIGLTTDVNRDSMLLVTMGLSYHQSGNSSLEPFVTSPYVWFRFNSSQKALFLYSDLEAIVNSRSYLSGMIGIGYRVSKNIEFVGGFHHTEFIMPTEQATYMVDGLKGMMIIK